MDLIIFEDDIKYDRWIKLLLIFPIVLFVVFGILFYMDAHGSDLFPKESAKESNKASAVFFGSIFIVLAVYWFFLPRKIFVTREKLMVKFGSMNWNIPYKTIASIRPAQELIVWWAHSFMTSYGSQVEIVRKNRLKIRVSPSRRDQFLKYANRAIADWTRVHQPDSNFGRGQEYQVIS